MIRHATHDNSEVGEGLIFCLKLIMIKSSHNYVGFPTVAWKGCWMFLPADTTRRPINELQRALVNAQVFNFSTGLRQSWNHLRLVILTSLFCFLRKIWLAENIFTKLVFSYEENRKPSCRFLFYISIFHRVTHTYVYDSHIRVHSLYH